MIVVSVALKRSWGNDKGTGLEFQFAIQYYVGAHEYVYQESRWGFLSGINTALITHRLPNPLSIRRIDAIAAVWPYNNIPEITSHPHDCIYFEWWDIILTGLNFQKSIPLPLIMKYWRSSSCNRYNWREESSGRDGKPTRDSCCEVKVKFQYLYLWTVTFKSAQAHVCLSFRQLVDEQLTKKTSFYTTVPLDQLPGPVYHESTLTADILNLKYKATKISYTVSTLTHRLECQEWTGRRFLYLKQSLLNLSHPQICVSSGVQPLWLPLASPVMSSLASVYQEMIKCPLPKAARPNCIRGNRSSPWIYWSKWTASRPRRMSSSRRTACSMPYCSPISAARTRRSRALRRS